MIKIIVDSTCDISQEIVDKYDISIVPLRISIGNVEYYDKVTIQIDEVYENMRQGIVPKTSQVAPLSFYDVFEKTCKKGENIIYLSFSSKLSGTHDLGVQVLNEFKEKYKDIKMEIIDSKAGTTAIAMLALECIKMDEQGKSFEEIVINIKEKIKHIEHIFTLGDLNWLVKGGRISKVKGVVGTVLDIKPVLHIKDGEMEVIKTLRGRKRTIKYILDILEERGIAENELIGLSHGDDYELVNEIKENIISKFGEKEFMINKIGCVLGSHVGLTGMGVFFYNNK